MANQELFLKLANPADMLSVRFLAETGQITGEFIQEAEAPWTVWWRLPQAQDSFFSKLGKFGDLMRGKPALEAATVWEPGIPQGRVKKADWLDVFRQFVLTRDDSPLPTDTIILRTTDRGLFFEVVRRHFLLQQGAIEFAALQSTPQVWLIRIRHPSLWALELLPDEKSWEWFNQVPGCDNLFVEKGFGLSAITNGARLNHFQILDNTVVLLRSKGDLQHFSAPWRHAATLVEVRAAAPQVQIAEEKEKLQITPRLRETEESRSHSLWRVDDLPRLKAIIGAESLKRLSGYSGWFGQDGIFWVLATSEQSDRGLAGVLSDAFPAWVPLEERVFVPSGRALLPRLSAERLCQIFGCARTDWLVFSPGHEGLQTTCLPAVQLHKLEYFISFLAERTIDAFPGFTSKWEFSFPDLKKKRMSVEVELPGRDIKRLQAVGDPEKGVMGVGGPVAFKRQGRRTEFISLDRIPAYSQHEQTDMQTRIREIDRLLIKTAENPILWKERAALSWQLKAPISALVSSLTGAMLQRDPKSLLDHVFDFAGAHREFALLDAENVSALDRGNLLATIRNPKLEAELHYALHLAFATRFQDPDIFRQAIDAMRTGYSGDRRPFHDFLDNRAIGPSESGSRGKISLLGLGDLQRIRPFVDQFLRLVGCCRNYEVLSLIRRQFNLLLRTHLNEQTANRLVSSMGAPHHPVLQERWTDLERWPDLPNVESRPESTRRWFDLVTMSRLKNTTMSDFFTGSLYKPAFLFHRQTADGRGEIERTFWLSQLPFEQLPPVSDGRPIARAIYERYTAGHEDWAEYFQKAADGTTGMAGRARGQRVLLFLVTEFGPLQDFKALLPPLHFTLDQSTQWDIFTITSYTDLYRLYLAYHQTIDEQRLFQVLIQNLPKPPHGAEHFRDGAESVVLCLFLSTSPRRRFQFDDVLNRTLAWLEFAADSGEEALLDDLLTVTSFLEIGVLANLVAEDLELHQFQERRRALWLEHARSLSGSTGFDRWMSQYKQSSDRPR